MIRENDISDDSDTSDEDIGLLRKALHVELPKNFDPSKAPQNGEEYLQHVMYEAKRCPDLMVAPINIKRKKPSIHLNMVEEFPKSCNTIIPSLIWQENQIDDFKKVKTFIGKQPVAKLQQQNQNLKVLINSEVPKLSIIKALSQEDKVKALQYIVTDISEMKAGNSISRQKSLWIYSLLATLDIPLCPETCHLLRELARKCHYIRSNLSGNATMEQYAPLNLYICLISRHYGQLDLADS